MSYPPEAYLFAVARRAGCPPMWIEDCAQECRIAMWRAPGVAWKTVVQREAIDFVRSILGRSKASQEGHSTWSLDGDLSFYLGYTQDIDSYIERKALVERARQVLSPAQFDACFNEKAVEPGRSKKRQDRQNSLRFQGRRKLKRLVA